MNFGVKQEKERVNQCLRDEKVSDTSVLVQVRLCVFTYSRNESLSDFIETAKKQFKIFSEINLILQYLRNMFCKSNVLQISKSMLLEINYCYIT